MAFTQRMAKPKACRTLELCAQLIVMLEYEIELYSYVQASSSNHIWITALECLFDFISYTKMTITKHLASVCGTF